jgi:hypothetical protein
LRSFRRFSFSSPLFSVIVFPALLQSDRNPIQAAVPFPVKNAADALGEHPEEPSQWPLPMTAPKQ